MEDFWIFSSFISLISFHAAIIRFVLWSSTLTVITMMWLSFILGLSLLPSSVFQKRQVRPTTVRVISAVLSILIGCLIFLAVPTVVFQRVEEWSFLQSLYFVVITLTTVGFGDFVPGVYIFQCQPMWIAGWWRFAKRLSDGSKMIDRIGSEKMKSVTFMFGFQIFIFAFSWDPAWFLIPLKSIRKKNRLMTVEILTTRIVPCSSHIHNTTVFCFAQWRNIWGDAARHGHYQKFKFQWCSCHIL